MENNIEIKLEKVTDFSLLQSAVNFIFGVEVKAFASKWYAAQHSPIKTQWFVAYCTVPYSVAMQMVRHEKEGAFFLIESGRPDTGTAKEHFRDAPRRMFIMFNAQHAINWSHKRLCMKAETATRVFMEKLVKAMYEIDPPLAPFMIPMCEYRNGICTEFKPCGKIKKDIVK